MQRVLVFLEITEIESYNFEYLRTSLETVFQELSRTHAPGRPGVANVALGESCRGFSTLRSPSITGTCTQAGSRVYITKIAIDIQLDGLHGRI
jgi:hypothetical protein